MIRFGSQSSNEPLWRESDLEDYRGQCKTDWSDEEQEELMESLKTLHELQEWWKNMDKSGDENRKVPLRNVSRVTKSEGGNHGIGMFAHSFGNSELEKILELKMIENYGYRVSSVGTEFNEQATKSSSGKGKRMRVWEGEKCVSCEICCVPVSEPLRVEQGVPGRAIDPETGSGRHQGSFTYSRKKASNATGRK